MLGLLLIYFIGKAYYNLAIKYNKNKWAFTILGIAAYYGGAFAGGIIIEIAAPGLIDQTSDIVLNLMAIPLGGLACWLLYMFLNKRWFNNDSFSNEDLLDSDLLDEL